MKICKQSNKINDEINFNHTTKILRFYDYLNKTNFDLCILQQNLQVI